MSDFAIPDYTPIYPITKIVKPRQRTARFPDWGIEQRATVGQNQTSPEWSVKWVLLPADADILDEFLAARARRGEWFLWTPPGGTIGRYRCDDWTKTLPNCSWREFQATFRQVYSYELPSIPVETGTFVLSGTVGLFPGSLIATLAGDFVLAGGDATLAEARPFYADTGAFNLAASNVLLARSLLFAGGAASFAYSGSNVTLVYFTLQGTYFTDIASQIWGWDRDFQVDWWGD